ncbi:MAG: 3-oxoacyl-ACP reductase FabG [Deltaproteobacteria bacterium]|nr:3-oxoacyl-ACP reductase FabG [Deltaproteobacteria bacterium]
MRLKDRVAIVTGAARGLGEAIALRFAEEGAQLVLGDVDVENAQRTAQKVKDLGRQAFALKVDVSKYSEVQGLVDEALRQFKRVDILVNNAGITRDAQIKNMTEEMWDLVVDVNLKGAFNGCKAVYKPMSEQKYGKIVSLSSRAYLGNFGQVNYSASKAGIVGLTRTLALEFARFNANVNAIAPSMVETDIVKTVPKEVFDRVVANIPFKRIGQPREIANVALFLASDEASYVTGQTIIVCGGRSIGFGT